MAKKTNPGCCCGSNPPPCTICVHATDQCSPFGDISGATFTVSQSGTTIGTCTTDGSGQCCVDVTATGSGTYVISVSKTGYAGSTQTVTISCPGSHTYNLTLVVVAKQIDIVCHGCNSLGAPGVDVTINGGTYTTDSTGHVYLSAPVGTYTWTTSHPRFTASSHSITVGCGGSSTGNANLTPASGYHCPCLTDCAWPLKDTLTLTDSVLGTVTLSYGTGWQGTMTYNFPGYCGCPSASGISIFWTAFTGACTARGVYGVNFNLGPACPNNAGGAETDTVGSTSHTCPENGAFNYSGTITLSPCPTPASFGMIWQGSTPTVTITE